MSLLRFIKISPFLSMVCIFLVSCQAFGGSSNQPLPTVVLGGQNTAPIAPTKTIPSNGEINNTGSGSVTASGNVVAAQDANLGLLIGGKVLTVHATIGDQVKIGQVLVELDTTDIQLAIKQANRNLQEMTSPGAIAEAEQAVAKAQSTVIQAKKDLDTAKLHRSYLNFDRGTEDQVAAAQAAYLLAQHNVDFFQSVYDQTHGDPTTDAAKALALSNLSAAKTKRDKALENLNWFLGKPSTLDVAEADTNVALAQANLDTANTTLQEAQWYYSAVKGETIPDTATGIKLQQLYSARDDLTGAQKKLEDAQLVSMIEGTVTAVNIVPGEIITAGEVLISISDVSRLHVETTDLSERDVPSVKVGQPVLVTIKALNKNIGGKVTLISPLASNLGGDVVYKTTIALDSIPAGLLAGMSVDVQYLSTQ